MTVQAQLLPGAFENDPVINPFEASDAKRLSLLTRNNPMSVPAATTTEATSFSLAPSTARTVGVAWTNLGKYSVEYYQGKEGLFPCKSRSLFSKTPT